MAAVAGALLPSCSSTYLTSCKVLKYQPPA